MLWTIAMILLVLWAIGFFTANAFGGLIHLLLVVGIVALIYHFMKGKPTTPGT